MQKCTSQQGHAIFKKGDTADKVFLILRGQVCLQDGKTPLADGQFFGFPGVFSAERLHTDSASCLTDFEYGVIGSEKFFELLHQDARFGNYVIRALVQRHFAPGQKSDRSAEEKSNIENPRDALPQL